MTLKYQHVISNTGASYNPTTVRGVYYFRFTMYNNNSGKTNAVVVLMMNSKKSLTTWDTEGADVHCSASNAAGVQRFCAALFKQPAL